MKTIREDFFDNLGISDANLIQDWLTETGLVTKDIYYERYAPLKYNVSSNGGLAITLGRYDSQKVPQLFATQSSGRTFTIPDFVIIDKLNNYPWKTIKFENLKFEDSSTVIDPKLDINKVIIYKCNVTSEDYCNFLNTKNIKNLTIDDWKNKELTLKSKNKLDSIVIYSHKLNKLNLDLNFNNKGTFKIYGYNIEEITGIVKGCTKLVIENTILNVNLEFSDSYNSIYEIIYSKTSKSEKNKQLKENPNIDVLLKCFPDVQSIYIGPETICITKTAKGWQLK